MMKLLIIALALALATPAAAQPARTLVVGLVAEPVNLDPAQVTDLNSNRVGRRVVETLVTFPDESTQIVPGLAESWTISKDGLQYTFKLRSGVKFHDGTPLTAEAVSSPSSGRSTAITRRTSSASTRSRTSTSAT
jgi:peptide/nickel transport system substrate-binding protein